MDSMDYTQLANMALTPDTTLVPDSRLFVHIHGGQGAHHEHAGEGCSGVSMRKGVPLPPLHGTQERDGEATACDGAECTQSVPEATMFQDGFSHPGLPRPPSSILWHRLVH